MELDQGFYEACFCGVRSGIFLKLVFVELDQGFL